MNNFSELYIISYSLQKSNHDKIAWYSWIVSWVCMSWRKWSVKLYGEIPLLQNQQILMNGDQGRNQVKGIDLLTH